MVRWNSSSFSSFSSFFFSLLLLRYWVMLRALLLCSLVFPPQGFYCNATSDEIGTCWPQSSAGSVVERPCPEYINGVKYNTTSKRQKLLSALIRMKSFCHNKFILFHVFFCCFCFSVNTNNEARCQKSRAANTQTHRDVSQWTAGGFDGESVL